MCNDMPPLERLSGEYSDDEEEHADERGGRQRGSGRGVAAPMSKRYARALDLEAEEDEFDRIAEAADGPLLGPRPSEQRPPRETEVGSALHSALPSRGLISTFPLCRADPPGQLVRALVPR